MACPNGTRKKLSVTNTVFLNVRDVNCAVYGEGTPFCLFALPTPVVAVDAVGFCGSPPPAMPDLNALDFFNLPGLAEKLIQIAKIRSWNTWCECIPSGIGQCQLATISSGRTVKGTNLRVGNLSAEGRSYGFTGVIAGDCLPDCPGCMEVYGGAPLYNNETFTIASHPDGQNACGTCETSAPPEPDAPPPPPVYPPDVPPMPPPPPGPIGPIGLTGPRGDVGATGEQGLPGEDAKVEFENVQVATLVCDTDGGYKRQDATIQVIKSDTGSTSQLYQRLFDLVANVGLVECADPVLVTQVLGSVVHPGKLLPLTKRAIRIHFELSIIPNYVGRRLGGASPADANDLFRAGGYALVKGVHKSVEIPLVWQKQYADVDEVDGVRVYVLPGFEVTVSVENLPGV